MALDRGVEPSEVAGEVDRAVGNAGAVLPVPEHLEERPLESSARRVVSTHSLYIQGSAYMLGSGDDDQGHTEDGEHD